MSLKVSEFDPADPLDGSELVGLVQGAENRKSTLVNLATGLFLTIETVAGATYTFAADDNYKQMRFTNAGAVTATVPLNASDPIPIGTRIRCVAVGVGGVTLDGEGAVVLNSRDNALSSAGQFAVFEIVKVATNEWDCLGDLA